MENLTTTSIALIPTLTSMALGITAVFGEAGLNSRYKPLVSLFIAIGASILYTGMTKESIIIGIIGGLMASGLWSGTKSVTNKDK